MLFVKIPGVFGLLGLAKQKIGTEIKIIQRVLVDNWKDIVGASWKKWPNSGMAIYANYKLHVVWHVKYQEVFKVNNCFTPAHSSIFNSTHG